MLDRLEAEALDASLDLRTAALRFAEARGQRGVAEAEGGPRVGLTAAATRQRQSELGAGTRLIDVIGTDRDRIAPLLAQPFTLYQAGFDASWEPDLWGRVRHAVEAADADVASQAALLDLARLSLASEVARRYLDVRTAQAQIALLGEDEAALRERLRIVAARVRGGTLGHADLARQQSDLAARTAQLPALRAQEAAGINQLTLLLGKRPGELRTLLAPGTRPGVGELPDLSLGLPSDVARRRPDIRNAEAQLRRATANIGIARADLYPSIRLGAHAGFESYLKSDFTDWGSRTWSIGPSLDLPLFDHGRRQRVVQLRELQQQEAAIQFQRTVLQAWQEIDDGLSSYAANQQERYDLMRRVDSAREAYELAQARFAGGTTDYVAVIDAQRNWLQARFDLVASEGKLRTAYVILNKALGNVISGRPSG
ncbi:efflux transporter outer membrane subunit [Telluria mixta]|uniref:efflux transporter outer membrane subunit n=1 Tax=Telluria mixta TaxID=34071 RepID=UPI00247A8CE8|nr:efflux transporter outer membrane subunit [Telluria mixta]WEM95730.1 efflux transporter outer membrane subunit [Telluria mixta]